MPEPILTTALEMSPAVGSAIAQTQKIKGTLSTIARTARLLDGEWIPELVTQAPGVKQGFGFFTKTVEKPVKCFTHKTLTHFLQKEIKKQLLNALRSPSQTLIKAVVGVFPWTNKIFSLVSPLVPSLTGAAIEKLSTTMLNALDPLICAPTAQVIASHSSYIMAETAKMYVGHHVQFMVVDYLAEQFKESEYPSVSTGLEYAKQADDYRVLVGLFTMILAANLLPYFYEKLLSVSNKEEIKAQLTQIVLLNSNIDPSTYPGQIYTKALKSTLDQLFDLKIIDVNRIKMVLTSLQATTSVSNYLLND